MNLVNVEILKGDARGSHRKIGAVQARALAHVGFLRISDSADAAAREGNELPNDDQSELNSVDPDSTQEISPITGRPKRTYRRRDMTAEDC